MVTHDLPAPTLLHVLQWTKDVQRHPQRHHPYVYVSALQALYRARRHRTPNESEHTVTGKVVYTCIGEDTEQTAQSFDDKNDHVPNGWADKQAQNLYWELTSPVAWNIKSIWLIQNGRRTQGWEREQ